MRRRARLSFPLALVLFSPSLFGQTPGAPQALSADVDPLAASHYQRGLQAIQKGDLPTAVREFRVAVKYAPKSAPAHNSLGWVFLETGEVDRAAIEFRKAIALEPQFTEAYFNMARALERRNDLDGATQFYQYAIRQRPDWPDAHVALGKVLGLRGNVQGAHNEFEAAATLATNTGARLLREGNVDGAIEQFRAALKLAPDHAPAHYQLGMALREKGDLAQAATEFEKAHQLDPRLRPPRD